MANFNSGLYPQPNNFGFGQNSSYGNYGQNQNQGQQYNTQSGFNNVEPTLKGRPVTSIEEARAMSIDLDGSISYFPDITNKRIYTKQFNPDGSASFKVYIEDNTNQSNLRYVTQQELVDVVAGIRAMINNYALGINPLNVAPQQNNNASIENQTVTKEAENNTSSGIFNI